MNSEIKKVVLELAKAAAKAAANDDGQQAYSLQSMQLTQAALNVANAGAVMSNYVKS